MPVLMRSTGPMNIIFPKERILLQGSILKKNQECRIFLK